MTDDILRVGFVGAAPIVYLGPPRVKLFDEQARLLLPDAAHDAAFNPMSGFRRPGSTASLDLRWSFSSRWVATRFGTA